MNKRFTALWGLFALCAALVLPGFALGQGVRASSAPNPPTNVHVTGISVNVEGGGWLVGFAWYAPYPFAGIAVSNGSVVTTLSGGATTYAQTVAPGYWACLSVVAYNASGASPWTPWVCGFAIPAMPSGVHVTGHNASSVSFAWTDQDPYSGIAASTDGVTTLALGQAATTYIKTGMVTGDYACISVVAYNSYNPGGIVGTSDWTTWVCGQAV